mgnify:CR=1 FL=1
MARPTKLELQEQLEHTRQIKHNLEQQQLILVVISSILFITNIL